jgi:SAM-dependent methyltransferase
MRNPFVAPTITEVFFSRGEKFVSDDEFFSFIRLPNGTFKTTRANRLSDIDERLVALLSHEARHYDLLDVACSSGTCTAELADTLSKHGIVHSMHASDLFLHAMRLRLPPLTVLYCEDRHILQVDFAGCAFPNTPPSKLSRGLFFVARRLIGFGQWIGLAATKVPLLSTTARRSSIEFSEGDVFGEVYRADPALRFDVIRAANLLSTGYFTESEIKRAIANAKRHLRSDGLLVLVRTEDDVNRASIYRLHNASLELVEHHNGGVDSAAWLAEPSE